MKDRWGVYHILSGHESPDACFWCGKPCRNRFCSADCKLEYWRHYHWKEAREWCLERADRKCQKCGNRPIKHPSLKIISYEAFLTEIRSFDKAIISKEEYNNIAFDFLCEKESGTYYHRIFRRLKNEYQKEYEKAVKEHLDSQLEIHHIMPINGGRRDWSVLNRQENLTCLCRKCHRQIESEG